MKRVVTLNITRNVIDSAMAYEGPMWGRNCPVAVKLREELGYPVGVGYSSAILYTRGGLVDVWLPPRVGDFIFLVDNARPSRETQLVPEAVFTFEVDDGSE